MNNEQNQLKIRDMVFGEIAARYVERYGSVLQRELSKSRVRGPDDYKRVNKTAKADSDGDAGGWAEAGAGSREAPPKPARDEERKLMLTSAETDELILNGIAAEYRKRILLRSGLVAAAAAFMIITLFATGAAAIFADIWNGLTGNGPAGGITGATHPSGGTTAAANAQAPGLNNERTTQADPQGPGAAEDWSIPIGFPIKPAYSVVSSIQDGGRSVYFIANTRQDNIVLSLRRGALNAQETSKLTYTRIGGIDVYLAYDADYSLMLFEMDDIIYEMTCRYDVNTLIDFCGFENRGYARGVLNPGIGEGGFNEVAGKPLSDIPLKTETASYNDIRRRIIGGEIPPPGAVVTEELINAFPMGGALPEEGGAASAEGPFDVFYDIGPSPFNDGLLVAYVRIKTPETDWDAVPPSNITFLINTSSSMFSFDKIPLIKEAILQMAERMGARDRVSIVSYDDGSSLLLDNASGGDKASVRDALDGLTVGGHSSGAAGISEAFTAAQNNFIVGGNNVVIAITDDYDNFGMEDMDALDALIEYNLDGGVGLRVLAAGALNMRGDGFQMFNDGGAPWTLMYAGSLASARDALLDALSSGAYLTAGDASAQIEFNPANIVAYNLFGYENRFSNNREQLFTVRDMERVYGGNEIIILYELTPAAHFAIPSNEGGESLEEGEIGENTPGGENTPEDGNANSPLGEDDETPEDTNAPSGAAASAEAFANELFELRIKYVKTGQSDAGTFSRAATVDDVRAENSAHFYQACSAAAFGAVLSGGDGAYASIELAESLAEDGALADAEGRRQAYQDLLRQYGVLIR